MSYEKQTWVDGVSPLNAERMNHMEEGIFASAANFDYAAHGLPIVYLNGDVSQMSKDNAVTLEYVYGERTGTASVKWQGSSSLAYPKKNYSIEFDTAFEAQSGWGEQSEYCLKANWVDFSHVRNVCAAKLWGILRREEGTTTAYYNTVNAGAIDGFPVAVVVNDEYRGLYSFNIPKKPWLFGFSGDSATECVIGANNSTDATAFKAPAIVDGTDFEFEYVADNADVDALKASFNKIQNLLSWATDPYMESYQAKVNVGSTLDYYIFATMFHANDNITKNFLMSTTDGEKWVMTPYDLDGIWGNHWSGKSYYNPKYDDFKINAGLNAVFNLWYTYRPQQLINRYRALRKYQLSEARVLKTTADYMAKIPKAYYDEEARLWKDIPGTSTNNLSQIMEFYRVRCSALDAEIDALEASLSA